MLVSNDNYLGSFCCDDMEEYTKKPNKVLSFDPFYKKYDNSVPAMRLCVSPMEGTGVASQMYGGTQKAGYNQIAIRYCPWCGTEINFT